ncbi:MAG: acyl-CoA thioesterase II [Alphaproteobacteria bacterium]|nr:MAG: acyl-CoA thioesterase II [Alphaproteobacteria bacterium]
MTIDTSVRPAPHDMRALLDLAPASKEDVFIGHSPDTGFPRIFGGQILAQSLIAAAKTVDDPRRCPPHSLHGFFIRAGKPEVPVHFAVERVRDSRAFATRQVSATQEGKLIFTATVSFNVPEEGGFAHVDTMPAVKKPGEIARPTAADLEKRFGAKVKPFLERWERKETHEGRFVTDRIMFAPEVGDPDLQIWWRSTSDPALPPAEDDPILHTADLAFCSDRMYMDATLIPHGVSLMTPEILSVSICHTIWFHEPVDMHQWHLFSGHSSWAAHGRGHVHGDVYREDGLRVATLAQECLIRKA